MGKDFPFENVHDYEGVREAEERDHRDMAESHEDPTRSKVLKDRKVGASENASSQAKE